jgi:hypothetical protein
MWVCANLGHRKIYNSGVNDGFQMSLVSSEGMSGIANP